MTNPTRPLIGPKPLHYVNSVRTDIRRTFRRFRLLDYLRRHNGIGIASLAVPSARTTAA
ncbi:hypothetical protein [Scleromatobacter humisilvae]|uniref:Uncharacterized protein n=1 Tax=Scleromatobacter humisilvae TaxID=2897159 RepID=A0A9X2C371_9BURK|nr:hypothetical protein [Scleromatobacter humisilvae]MCK9689761.1 hypothetical protein [Scleromatobacter humisilvae]